MVSESGDVEMESPVKGEKTEGAPTHYAELDVKAMKVSIDQTLIPLVCSDYFSK